MRAWHLWDFSPNLFTISLNDEFIDCLKNKLNKTSFYKLGKNINLNYVCIHQAFNRNRFPLYIILKICNFLKINYKRLEENVISFTCYNGKNRVTLPVLPIIESNELYELIGHLLGDGYLSKKLGQMSNYTNTSKELIGRFIFLINTVFGKVHVGVYHDKRFNADTIGIPKALEFILFEMFPELKEGKMPQNLLGSHLQFASSFISAFADDESCVTTSAIVLTSINRLLLLDIKKLLLSRLGFSEDTVTEVKAKKNLFILSIKGKGLKKFSEAVGFVHPQKREDLLFEIERKNANNKPKSAGQIKAKITQQLNLPKTSKELSIVLKIQRQNISKHLRELNSKGYVGIHSISKYKVPKWIKLKEFIPLTDNYKNNILNLLLTKRDLRTKQISDYLVLSTDETLRYLHQLRISDKVFYKVIGKTYYWALK
ncbi:MAG: LAGLIDADG family homing endonuclease [Candidatus Nanoarchaeia archaeon]|nr:LAGLIDADG family homing endonuclease [Candidatus Nanoarchaeia archaeon]MDD5238912.1 LAGLIDADG family homing endonuclease [Candidatus Nanoarchaeia archaeon]